MIEAGLTNKATATFDTHVLNFLFNLVGSDDERSSDSVLHLFHTGVHVLNFDGRVPCPGLGLCCKHPGQSKRYAQ